MGYIVTVRQRRSNQNILFSLLGQALGISIKVSLSSAQVVLSHSLSGLWDVAKKAIGLADSLGHCILMHVVQFSGQQKESI